MSIKVGINGFGRIGRMVFRASLDHPEIEIVDFDFYDTAAFNQCENAGCALMAVENWRYVHPLLKILPVNWDYTIPFGILHAPEPTPVVQQFLQAVQQVLKN